MPVGPRRAYSSYTIGSFVRPQAQKGRPLSGRIPVSFEPNVGQETPQVRYLARRSPSGRWRDAIQCAPSDAIGDEVMLERNAMRSTLVSSLAVGVVCLGFAPPLHAQPAQGSVAVLP